MPERADDSHGIDSGMEPEPPVLGLDDDIHQILRHLVQGDEHAPQAVRQGEHLQFPAVPIQEHLAEFQTVEPALRPVRQEERRRPQQQPERRRRDRDADRDPNQPVMA